MPSLFQYSVKRVTAFYKINRFTVWFFLALWLALSLATSHKDMLYFAVNESYSAEPWVLYVRGFLLWTLAVCCVPFILKLARLFSLVEKAHRWRNLFLHFFFSICFLFVLSLAFASIFYVIVKRGDSFIDNHLLWTMYWYSLPIPLAYWFIIGGFLLKENAQLYNTQHQKAVALQSELNKIQLNILQVQLRPHFLFNALNTVSTLIYEDPTAATQVLKKIRTYLGLSAKATEPEITLQKEIDFTNLYLDIEKERYSDRLQVEQKIAPEVKTALVPNMILQPLVENAIRHGISKERGPGKLILCAVRNNNHLLLEVENSGAGFESVSITNGKGLGIKNTVERLEKLYNENYTFRINRSSLGGVKVSVEIPLHLN